MRSYQNLSPADRSSGATFHGYIHSIDDALLLVEAVRRGIAPRVYSRLTDLQQQRIVSGSVFIWNENEAHIKRWTDGKFWSNSRMKGRFFLYKELSNSKKILLAERQSQKPCDAVGKHRGRNDKRSSSPSSPFKDFLRKKTISVRTITNEKFHLVSYYYDSDLKLQRLERPSNCISFKRLHVEPGFYLTGLDETPLMINNRTDSQVDPRLYQAHAADSNAAAPSLHVPLEEAHQLMRMREEKSASNAASPAMATVPHYNQQPLDHASLTAHRGPHRRHLRYDTALSTKLRAAENGSDRSLRHLHGLQQQRNVSFMPYSPHTSPGCSSESSNSVCLSPFTYIRQQQQQQQQQQPSEEMNNLIRNRPTQSISSSMLFFNSSGSPDDCKSKQEHRGSLTMPRAAVSISATLESWNTGPAVSSGGTGGAYHDFNGHRSLLRPLASGKGASPILDTMERSLAASSSRNQCVRQDSAFENLPTLTKDAMRPKRTLSTRPGIENVPEEQVPERAPVKNTTITTAGEAENSLPSILRLIGTPKAQDHGVATSASKCFEQGTRIAGGFSADRRHLDLLNDKLVL